MDKKWMLKRANKEHGPMSERQLRKLAAQGKLRPSDLLRVDGDSGWTAAANIEGLLVRPSSEGASKSPAPNSGASPDLSEQADSEPAGVPTFGEWYGSRWPSKLMWIFQIPLWAIYGFVWIPIWYFCTATSSGTLKERWYALPLSGRAITCLPLLLPLMLVNSWMRPPSSSQDRANKAPELVREVDRDIVQDEKPVQAKVSVKSKATLTRQSTESMTCGELLFILYGERVLTYLSDEMHFNISTRKADDRVGLPDDEHVYSPSGSAIISYVCKDGELFFLRRQNKPDSDGATYDLLTKSQIERSAASAYPPTEAWSTTIMSRAARSTIDAERAMRYLRKLADEK